jgi:cold-inducible RNA-binding protein
MGNKIYVGNLPFSATSESLNELFSKFGTVDSAKIVMDRDTGRSKGFGFVEMSSGDEAQAAIEKLNGSDLGGRSLVVNEARPMEPRTGGFGGDRGGRGGDRGGRGGFGGGRGGDRGERGGNRW